MKIRTIGLLSLAFAVCVSSALVAQEEGRGRGRGGPGFGGGMGMGMSGGALELLGLLRMEEVQKELGMTPETYKSLQEALPDLRSVFQASEGDRAAKLKEANAKAQDVIDEALSPKQQKRLLGLLVQQQGARAVTNELVAKQIGLEPAKAQEIREVLMKSGEKMREAFTGGGDREKMREAMEEIRKEIDQAVAAKLSDKQKEDLEELKGDAFTFPERSAAGRGGPGGRGPGPGAGGQREGGPGQGGRGQGGRGQGNRRGGGDAPNN